MSSSVYAAKTALISGGNSQGLIFVNSNDKFAVGATVTLQDNAGRSVSGQIVNKIGLNQLVLAKANGTVLDLSSWTVDKGAYLTQTAQTVAGSATTEGTDTKVITGLMLTTPNSASTQATGTGDTVGNVGYDKGIVVINGTVLEAVASGSSDLTVTWGTGSSDNIASGHSAIATVYCYNNSGTLTFGMAKGVPAVTGQQVALTDAAVMTAASLTAANYIRVGDVTINRTGDTTVTQSQNNTTRYY